MSVSDGIEHWEVAGHTNPCEVSCQDILPFEYYRGIAVLHGLCRGAPSRVLATVMLIP